jgi:AcrR family transcriptional regulator
MSPRAYDRRLRQAASEEAKRRIVQATAELHAERGARATTHAMIARRAGVSIPTVYKYFPTANDLVPACTGLVAGRAPVRLDETLFEGLHDVPARVRALAAALFRLHEYFAPWLRWSDADAPAFPALREYLKQVEEHQVAMIRRALTAEGSKPAPETLVRLARILLDFSSWRALTEALRSTDRAAAAAADAILTIHRTPRFSKEKS